MERMDETLVSAGLRERKRERTHLEILDAARKIFAQYGYADAQMKDIADEAMVSPMTLRRYFGSKAGLYVAAAKATRASGRQILTELLGDSGAALELIQMCAADEAH